MHAINESASGDIQCLFDERKLREALRAGPADVLPTLKSAVDGINQGLRTLYRGGTPVEEIVLGRAALVDRVLTTLFEHFFAPVQQRIALIAVGGYGRGRRM